MQLTTKNVHRRYGRHETHARAVADARPQRRWTCASACDTGHVCTRLSGQSLRSPAAQCEHVNTVEGSIKQWSIIQPPPLLCPPSSYHVTTITTACTRPCSGIARAVMSLLTTVEISTGVAVVDEAWTSTHATVVTIAAVNVSGRGDTWAASIKGTTAALPWPINEIWVSQHAYTAGLHTIRTGAAFGIGIRTCAG